MLGKVLPAPPRIKFCGITRVLDIEFAAALGVDALGFVCVPASKRFVDLDQLQELTRALPPFMTSVGLFQNATADQVRKVLQVAQFSLLQFHGSEDQTFCQSFGLPFIKAVPMVDRPNLLECANAFSQAKALLLDAHSLQPGGKIGGSGEAFVWDDVPTDFSARLVLAGGLNASNVNAGIARFAPYAVDVSSGIETVAGIKDQTKMRAFVDVVRGANGLCNKQILEMDNTS
jgi:phosphoribosylanthranilate isomerase